MKEENLAAFKLNFPFAFNSFLLKDLLIFHLFNLIELRFAVQNIISTSIQQIKDVSRYKCFKRR
jgi:hypothetical protein